MISVLVREPTGAVSLGGVLSGLEVTLYGISRRR